VVIGHRDDARAVRPLDDRGGLGAATVDPDLARPHHEEAVGLIVPNDGAAALLDDDAVRLANEHAIAFAHLAPFAADVVDATQRLPVGAGGLRLDRAALRDGGLCWRLRGWGRGGRTRRRHRGRTLW